MPPGNNFKEARSVSRLYPVVPLLTGKRLLCLVVASMVESERLFFESPLLLLYCPALPHYQRTPQISGSDLGDCRGNGESAAIASSPCLSSCFCMCKPSVDQRDFHLQRDTIGYNPQPLLPLYPSASRTLDSCKLCTAFFA
ncbi:Hypothetical predicted protein [Podarcis lilfordi]|uniref:Uncharacterized protein n=1 Tax=Podarcis lilfordi TaxID=74358 RepID=A0AA35JZ71_9SAUR|nr:Hypothetical predicted protein [Podarcis lilfordi]